MTRFMNQNNPLRRQAPKQGAKAPTQAQRPGQRRQAAAGKAVHSEPKGIPTPMIDKFASASDEQNFEAQGNGGIFNPKRFAGYTDGGSIRRVMASKNERMYDKSGEINAWDKKDALNQAAYLLQHVTKGSPLNQMSRSASRAEAEERRKVLAAALSDPTGEGFALVGQELALPIKSIIDYEGWIRKILRVRTLNQGELFRIPKDVRSSAYSVGQDGQSVESRLYGLYLQPDEGKITSFPEVDLLELYQLNFDILDRAQDTARQEIERMEDKRGHLVLDAASQAVNTVSSFATLSLSVLENLRYQVERHALIVDKFLINRQELVDVQVNMSGSLDPVTQRELNLAGYIGRFLGAHILTTAGTNVAEVIPAGTCFAVTSPEYLGEMGIRVELFSEPYNNFVKHETVKGWAFVEVVGFGIAEPHSVAKAVKS